MNKEFIPYEESVALKGLGFDETCFGYYKHTTIPNRIISNDLIIGIIKENRIYNESSNGNSLVSLGKAFIFAPLYRQAFRFFREKYNLMVSPFQAKNELGYIVYFFEIGKVDEIKTDFYSDDKSSYEEAELACLRKLIEIVKEKAI